MSLMRPLVNLGLRLMEKPFLASVQEPEEIREGFERKARFWFGLPRGARLDPDELGPDRIPALWAEDAPDAPVLLYFHGGGYVFGSPRTHASMLVRLARLAGARACLPDYRLAPEHPFPAAVEDARASFEALLDRGVAPGRIVIGGDSAGGGLALALAGDLCQRGGALPAGVFAFSPLSDLTFSGASFRANARADPMLPAARAQDLAEMYLQGAAPDQPLASPLAADFTGGPPVWLGAGDTEILLDDTRRMAARMREQGVTVTERIRPGLPHVWPIFWRMLPEGDATLQELAGWIRRLPASSGGN